MPAPVNAAEFLDLIERSQVADSFRLHQAVEKFRSTGGMPDDPGELAARLRDVGVLTAFHVEQLLAGRHKGFRIGKYRILSLLGSGGMGKVYLAEHVIMRRQVALKVLPKTRCNDASAIGRFQREARAVAALNHRNIVQAYDIDQDGDLHFLVMEYVPGMSLQDYVKQVGRVPWAHAADFMRQAAEGLQHAADNGLVHRDIKPGNLLLDPTGTIRVLDLGLAVFFEDATEGDPLTLKYNENVLGTADYLAPEQAIDSHNVDIRADVYSLGGTFYYLLTGSVPFPSGTVAQKLMWHQTRQPTSVRTFAPEIPPELEAVLVKMMGKHPDQRYASPAENAAALAPFARPLPAPFGDRPTGAVGSEGRPPSSKVKKPSGGRPSDAVPAAKAQPMMAAAPENGRRNSANSPRPRSQPSQAVEVKTRPAPAPKLETEPGLEFLTALSDPRTATRKDLPQAKTVRFKTLVQAKAAIGKIGGRRRAATAGATAGLLLLAVSFYFWPRSVKRPHFAGGATTAAEPVAKQRRPLPAGSPIQVKVDLDWSGPRTLADGIAAARPGQGVMLTKKSGGEWHTSPLTIGPGGIVGKEGVVVYGEVPGLILSGSAEGAPLLTVKQTNGVVLRDLILDGGGGPGPLLVLEGEGLAGTILDNVTFQNYTTEALRINNAQGSTEKPILLEGVVFKRALGEPGKAVNISGAADGPPTRSVVLEDCRILGGEVGVQVTGPIESLKIKECIFAQCRSGFRFNPGPAARAFQQFVCEGNTFWESDHGIVFEDPPPFGARLSITDNLFANVKFTPIASSQAIDARTALAATIERNAATAVGAPADPAKFRELAKRLDLTSVAFISTDPSNPGFLRPKADPKLATASPTRKFVGAVSPQ